MAVVSQIEDAIALPAGPHQPGEAQLGQVLGHRRRLGADELGQAI
jgi:hypothetical protein